MNQGFKEAGTASAENKETEKVKYQLMYNAAAGEHEVNKWTQDQLDNWEESGYRTQEGYFNEVGIYDSKEELDRAIKELEGEPVFAVFENGAAGEVYSSEENNLTGNWRGSREGHANLVAEYKTKEEADQHVEERKKYFDSLK